LQLTTGGPAARELSRCGGRSQKRTLANLSELPGDVIAALSAILKGGTVIGMGAGELEIDRALPHGHVAAALSTIGKM
jgi:hypothetical protein